MSDRCAVVGMFYAMLLETKPFGMEILATRDNAGLYFDALIAPGIAGGDPVLIANADGVAVGLCCMLVNRGGFMAASASAAEHAIYVAPGFRGRGIATAMRKRALAELSAAGVTVAQTYVYTGNRPAKRAMRRIGARVAGTVWNLPLND